MSPADSTTSRPQDKLYIFFLISFIPTAIFIDCIALYPPSIVPKPLFDLHEFYKTTFNDQLAIARPAWFHFFSLVELFYEVPVAVWGVWALSKKSHKAPAHLLVWAVVAFGTTITCMIEFYENALMSNHEKLLLILMFGAYALIFGVLGVDMFCRIQKTLGVVTGIENKQKTR